MDLVCGQVGTAESVSLPAEKDLAYCWHTAPGMTATAQRLLHIACKADTSASVDDRSGLSSPAGFRMMTSPPSSAAPSSPQSPLPDAQDSTPLLSAAAVQKNTSTVFTPVKGGLQGGPGPGHGHDDTDAGDSILQGLVSRSDASKGSKTAAPDTDMAWSQSFDCLAGSCRQVQVQLSKGQQCRVAVSVHKAGLQWQVVLQPSYVLMNQTADSVYVHYTGQLAASQTSKAQTRPKAGSPFTLRPASKASALSPDV